MVEDRANRMGRVSALSSDFSTGVGCPESIPMQMTDRATGLSPTRSRRVEGSGFTTTPSTTTNWAALFRIVRLRTGHHSCHRSPLLSRYAIMSVHKPGGLLSLSLSRSLSLSLLAVIISRREQAANWTRERERESNTRFPSSSLEGWIYFSCPLVSGWKKRKERGREGE